MAIAETRTELIEGCCDCAVNGCNIPWDCLVLTWTNYNAAIHGPSNIVTYIRKPTAQWLIEAFYDPSHCLWIDNDVNGIFIEGGIGLGVGIMQEISSPFDSWTHDGLTDAPYYILGLYYNDDPGYFGDYDITVSLGACVLPPL